MAEQLGEAVLVLRTDDSALDKGIAGAEGKARGLDGTFRQSATAVGASMDKIAGSVGKAEAVHDRAFASIAKRTGETASEVARRFAEIAEARKAGSAAIAKSSAANIEAVGRESAQISRFAKVLAADMIGVGNILGSPSSPFVVPVKQGPAVTSAMRLVSGAAGILGGMMGGLVVTGTMAAAAALAEFILKGEGAQAEIDELVAKLKEKAEKAAIAEAADRAYAVTLEGVTQALNENEKALEALSDANDTAARQALEKAIKQKIILQGIRDETALTLSAAAAQIELNRARNQVAGNDPRVTGPLNAENDASARRIEKLQAALPKIDAAIARAETQLGVALSRRVVEMASASEIDKLRLKYDGLVEEARVRAGLEKLTGAELKKQSQELFRQTEALRAQQRIDEEKLRKRKSNAGTGQSGRQITEAEARAIVKDIGGVPTSGFRTAKHNEDVGGVPNSFHTKGQALDIAKTAGLTLAKIIKAFEDQGVRLIEKLDEGDHFHIAWSKRGGSGPSQETLAKRALAEADAAVRREQAFHNERADLEGQVIDARQAQITSAEEIARLELQAIDLVRQKYNDNLVALQEQRKLLPEEAAELKKLNEERAKLRTEIVHRREQERQFRDAEAANQRGLEERTADLDAQGAVLQSQQGLARTQEERRAIEMRLLDLQFQEERLRLEAIIAYAERLRLLKVSVEEQAKADSAATIAQGQLSTLPTREANARAAATQQTAGPIEDLLNRLPQTAAEINEAFESIAANGLNSLADSITGVIMGTQSMGEAFNQIAQQIIRDIIAMTIKMLIFKALSAAFGGGLGGGGSSIAPSAGDIASGSFIGPRAKGGPVRRGGLYLVGEEGPEMFSPGQNGSIISNDNLRRSAAAGGARSIQLTNYNDFRGADASAVSAIEGRLDQMERDLPGRVVSTMQDARQRFVWR